MKKLILSLVLTLAFSATSFAGVTVKSAGGLMPMTTEAMEVAYDADGNVIDTPEMTYIDPYYNQGVSVNVEVREKYVPQGKMSVTGYFSVYGVKDGETARKQLEGKFTEAKSALAQYGKVRKGYLNVYEEGVYEGSKGGYSGNMDITVEMTSAKSYSMVQEKLSDIGSSSSYLNSVLDAEEAIEIEARNATKLKNLIAKKKGVYETILGYKLGKINSLSVSTWLDSYNFDEETGGFEAVVSAYAVLEENK